MSTLARWFVCFSPNIRQVYMAEHFTQLLASLQYQLPNQEVKPCCVTLLLDFGLVLLPQA